MNIVIVGLGLIGKNLQNTFLDKGHSVISVSRRNADINLDLLKPIKVDRLNNKFSKSIDVVIFTAFKIPKNFDDDNTLLLQENIEIINNFIQLCDVIKPRHIINLSSIAVYKNETGTITENNHLLPSFNGNCYYGLSKINSEQMISNFGNKNKVKVAHLRISQLLDENNLDSLQKSFMDELTSNNSVTLFANGTRESNFIYNSFLAESIIDKLISNGVDGTYNVGQFQNVYLDFAEKFISKYGDNNTKINLIDKGNSSRIHYDCSKLVNALN